MKINEFIPNKNIYSQLNSLQGKEEVKKQDSNSYESFGQTLRNNLESINEKQIKAEHTTDKFIKGEDVDIHEAMLNTEEAKLSLQLAVQVRNKLLEAYQEINRMQV